MATPKWISISSDQIDSEEHPKDAMWATESPSPYDVPSHVKALYDASNGQLEVDFKYIENEPLESHEIDRSTSIRVGTRSGRLWSITFHVYEYNKNRKQLAEAAEHYLKQASAAKPQSREITSKIISLKSNDLFSNQGIFLNQHAR